MFTIYLSKSKPTKYQEISVIIDTEFGHKLDQQNVTFNMLHFVSKLNIAWSQQLSWSSVLFLQKKKDIQENGVNASLCKTFYYVNFIVRWLLNQFLFFGWFGAARIAVAP